MIHITEEITFPRQPSLEPIQFEHLPTEVSEVLMNEIKEINAFSNQLHLSHLKNPNFVYAMKKCITLLLFRISTIEYEKSVEVGFFKVPQKVYDSAYIVGCLANHTPFFRAMDDLEFPQERWMLMDITKKNVTIFVTVPNQNMSKSTIEHLKRIKAVAKKFNWTGNIVATLSIPAKI